MPSQANLLVAAGRFTGRLLVRGTIPHHHVGSSSFKLRWTRLAERFQKSIGSMGWFRCARRVIERRTNLPAANHQTDVRLCWLAAHSLVYRKPKRKKKAKGKRRKEKGRERNFCLAKGRTPRTGGARRAPFDEFCFALRAQNL